MAQIDSYIRRVNKECNLSHLEDIYDLYEFIPNEDLRTLFAAFHTQLQLTEQALQLLQGGIVLPAGVYHKL